MELKCLDKNLGIYRTYLLIVPYGIEIRIQEECHQGPRLLIVPYGIEIDREQQDRHQLVAFNRTIWN